MAKRSPAPAIRLRGVRHNNLKNFDLDLPLGKLIVVTGLSGSGKSSFAFDTLFAEGQRRYIETFSPYARQFFDRMDKPQVDRIEGIPPAIAIEQRNTVKTTRSTVGTMTEICDYMKVLWPHIAQLYCRQCGQLVRKDSPQQIWESMTSGSNLTKEGNRQSASPAIPTEVLVAFTLPLAEKISIEESLALIAKQGYQRLLVESRTVSTLVAAGFGRDYTLNEAFEPLSKVETTEHEGLEIIRVDEAIGRLRELKPASIRIVQDRLKLTAANRARFIEACEQAYHFGKGKLAIYRMEPEAAAPRFFSDRFHCAQCDLEYREPSPGLFSFNNPVGACPTCRGFGRTITIDYDRAIPDRTKTLVEGAVRPWQTGHGLESQADLLTFCKARKVPIKVPFEALPKKLQEWVINGDLDYGKDSDHEWPRAWYGVKGYFRWLESKAYKMHVRVLLSRYRAYQTCPDCKGKRFQPEALLFRIDSPGANCAPHSNLGLSLADFYQLAIRDALAFIEELPIKRNLGPTEPIALVLSEIRSRLAYLIDVGLGYLTLDRPTRSLSGGETERVNLTTCLGTRLVNTLFVLDEPTVGLHPRDTVRLIRILHCLRDAGNTVLVVEHEPSVMRAADQIVDLGPGQGEAGGHVVFEGPVSEIAKCAASLTGKYLAGKRRIEIPRRRVVELSSHPHKLSLHRISFHNLRGLDVEIPLGRFVCVTGVSGSGKTTLVREVLHSTLEDRLKYQASNRTVPAVEESSEIEAPDSMPATHGGPTLSGWEQLSRVVLVDQSALGKTPRSNPAVYIGAFDAIRELFAQTDLARQRGLKASAFSFNSREGQCERCRGAGFEKIEMQFLSDIFIRCPDCNGRRYRPHILEVKVSGRSAGATISEKATSLSWSVADLLEATVDDTIVFLLGFGDSRPARQAVQSLKLLREVGLGYLRLGQPINTLSGGECQRLKLVSYLAEFTQASQDDQKPTLFLFDEPTTGLHFEDVRVLLQVFQRLVDAGHSLVVIEHNLDVIKCADWVIDLGPDAGDEGGQIVAQGTPEEISACAGSHTGRALREAGLL
ncbi:MAG: excinuclease ABC subunit UvrA [Verrucomicrobiota bacterium]